MSRENYAQVRLMGMMVMADWDKSRDEQTGLSFRPATMASGCHHNR
jgi:hypothetical protein